MRRHQRSAGWTLTRTAAFRSLNGAWSGKRHQPAHASHRQSPSELAEADGSASIASLPAFAALAYAGDSLKDPDLDGLLFVKFTVDAVTSEAPDVYFINTRSHPTHVGFARSIGLFTYARGMGRADGVIVYRPQLRAPSGETGLFTFEFDPPRRREARTVKRVFSLLTRQMPLLDQLTGLHPRQPALASLLQGLAAAGAFDLPVYTDADLFDVPLQFLALQQGNTTGRLVLHKSPAIPRPGDVIVVDDLPDDLPRVAGIITGRRQTPLSHVNVRAIQLGIPNAYVAGATHLPQIADHLGQ